MSRDVLTIGSTMRIPLLFRSEYSQWSERFMNYLEEQTDREAMINSIKNGDQPLPTVTQVSITGATSRLPNDIYSLTDNNKTAKDLWDALERHMLGSEYGEQDRKAAVLYEYETFKATEGELLLDTYIRYLQVINDLKKCSYSKDNCDVNDAMNSKKKAVVITSDSLALVAEQTKVSKRKEKVVVSSESEGSDDELTKITALLAKAFNRKKFYSKPTNNNLRTSSATSSANKKQEYVNSDDKKEDKKVDEKKRDMSKVKCYNCKKKGYFTKDCKKAKIKDYDYYKMNMSLAKKKNDVQVLRAEDHAWMESSSDSDQEINANIIFMAQMEKVLSDSEESSSSKEETIVEVSYYTFEFESESKYETLEYYDNSTNYGLFVNNDDDQEIFHDSSEIFSKNHIGSQMDHDQSVVDHNNSEETTNLINQLIKEFDKKIAKYQKRLEKANQQSKDFDNQTKFLQDKCDVLKNQTNTFEIANQEILFDKTSRQLVELDENVRMLKNTVLEKDLKISELNEYACNKDLEREVFGKIE
uniref:CCHC-type domain-containing protein n=1 Tax=Tanacetum cinerariifolium TaxID=118510 RepID=A0A6L2JBY7_TANCI|nr:hypothetical protein [Tanacetum cinerariifolium]